MSVRPILVTGAAGFIGRHTTLALRRAGFLVTAVDLRPAPNHLTSAARWRRESYANPTLLDQVAAGDFDIVVHQAGISDTRAQAGPELDETNVLAALRLADACRTGHARLIYASSHSVYGTLQHRRPIAENADLDPTRCTGPLNPYAASKLALDRQMHANHAHGLNWVGLRYTNVFGPDETDKGPMACILTQLLRTCAATGEISLFDDSLTAARDYIPVATVAATIVYLVRHPIPLGVYNLGAGAAVSFAELAEWCARLHYAATGAHLRIQLIPNPNRAAYQYFTCADMSKLDTALPDRPTISRPSIEARAAELFTSFLSRGDRSRIELLAPHSLAPQPNG